jgi:hypothetical protein
MLEIESFDYTQWPIQTVVYEHARRWANIDTHRLVGVLSSVIKE